MQIMISSTLLLEQLNLLAGAVERRTTIPVLSCMLLDARAGNLRLQATDLEVAMTCELEVQIDDPGVILVDMRRLHETVKSMPKAATLLLRTTPTLRLVVECGNARVQIAGQDITSWPDLPAHPDREPDFVCNGTALAAAMNLIEGTIDKKESRFALNGSLLISEGPDYLTLVSTDGHRLSRAYITGKGSQPKAMVYLSAINLVRKAFDNGEDVQIWRETEHIHFVNGSCSILARGMAGNFPDFNRVFPKDLPVSAELSSIDLQAALSRVRAAAERNAKSDPSVRIECAADGAKFTVDSPEGSAEDVVECVFSGINETPIHSAMNLTYMQHMASHFDALRWNLKNGDVAQLFESLDRTHQVVIMPQRV